MGSGFCPGRRLDHFRSDQSQPVAVVRDAKAKAKAEVAARLYGSMIYLFGEFAH
jgi:hypothetical protein